MAPKAKTTENNDLSFRMRGIDLTPTIRFQFVFVFQQTKEAGSLETFTAQEKLE